MTTLRQGDRGPAVLELQWLLRATGHDPGKLDGVFGPMTAGAVCAFDHPGSGCNEPIADEATVANLRTAPRLGVEMPRMLTPIAAVDMRVALVAGYADAFATRDVRVAPVRVALAQLCVEHGCEPWAPMLTVAPWLSLKLHEQAYIYVWGNNIGNRQVRHEDRGFAQSGPEMPTVSWFSMSPMEGTGAAAHPATSAHYSYPNAAEGAAAYWRFLRDHCSFALTAFEAGDPAAAARELKVGAWHYSGDEEAYARAMVDRFKAAG